MRFVADSSTELSPLSDDEGQSELELELNCQRESDQDFFDTESRWQRNFAIAVLYLTLASLEAFGGWRAGSLAVLSEAAYILGDCARFLMITFAMRLSRRRPTHKLTYGFHRMEIFGVLVGVAIRWISLGLFVYWAIRSFGVSKVISGRTMATAASISFFLNFGTLFSLYYRRKNSKISKPNQQLIHLEDLKFQVSLPGAGTQRLDFARSLIVVAVSGVIWAYPDRCIFDKICTLITAFFVFASTISTLKQCAQVLMEGTPPDLNYHEIREALSCIPRVHSVHDLHIWSVKFSRPVLTAHLRTLPSVDNTHVLLRAHRLLRTHFRIQQATIQIDPLPPPPPNDPT